MFMQVFSALSTEKGILNWLSTLASFKSLLEYNSEIIIISILVYSARVFAVSDYLTSFTWNNVSAMHIINCMYAMHACCLSYLDV
jgi:hypothetical protein